MWNLADLIEQVVNNWVNKLHDSYSLSRSPYCHQEVYYQEQNQLEDVELNE